MLANYSNKFDRDWHGVSLSHSVEKLPLFYMTFIKKSLFCDTEKIKMEEVASMTFVKIGQNQRMNFFHT